MKKKIKSQPVCPASAEEKPHFYSLHGLITVNFTEEEADANATTKTKQRICPACQKGSL